MRLPYQKDEIIGVDLYRLGQKYKDAFIIRTILYSHCFEYAITAIPKIIAYDKASDFTDDVDGAMDILVKRGLALVTDTEVIINGAPERVQNGIEYSTRCADKQKNYRDRQKEKKEQNSEEQVSNDVDERYKNRHPLSIKWDKISEMSEIQLKTSSAWLYNNKFSWDEKSVLSSLSLLEANKDKLKNKIMCDWHQDGFFKAGYEFNVETINNHFSKKVKGNNDNKYTGVNGVIYPEEYKSRTKPEVTVLMGGPKRHKIEKDDMDPEIRERLGDI